MALRGNTGRQEIIKSRDLRVCDFYAEWLRKNHNMNISDTPRLEGENYRSELNWFINKFIPDREAQKKTFSEMEIDREINMLPQENFDWLKNDMRATFWLWGYIYTSRDIELRIRDPDVNIFGPNWYSRLKLEPSPSSHNERFRLIICFFDRIMINTPHERNLKIEAMRYLKDKWRVIYNRPQPLKWLPDDEDVVLWAWNTLKKNQQERYDDRKGINISEPGLTIWFTPINHSERYLAIRAAIDLWEDAPDTKRLFLLNLNKAWNQQKLRLSRTDKKALNTYLKNDTKNRLDLLAARDGVRISDMLEKLINDYYRNIFHRE